MAGHLVLLGKLKAQERLAIDLLRGAGRAGTAQDVVDDFAALRRQGLWTGLAISPASSPFMGIDELRLLAWLTFLQRPKLVGRTNAPEGLEPFLQRCAGHLLAMGARLDGANLHRIQIAPSMTEHAAFKEAPGQPTLQSRVLQFVDVHGVVPTHELIQLGISRQTLSLMFKRGELRRVSYGKYAAVPKGR